jgi:hypothetical protein
MTHHAPFGAWSSLTFGYPGRGVSIDHQAVRVEDSGDLIVAVTHGGPVDALPFFAGADPGDAEAQNLDPAAFTNQYRAIPVSRIRRQLSPGVDRYLSDLVSLHVYTPHGIVPDPVQATQDEALRHAICPGIFMEVVFDNSKHSTPMQGYVGLSIRLNGRIWPLDWSIPSGLCGIAYRKEWALAAVPVPGVVGTVRDNRVIGHLKAGNWVVHNGANEGGIMVRVPAGHSYTLPLAFAFHDAGVATQGLEGRYLYNRFFPSLESVCTHMLNHGDRVREEARQFDESTARQCPDPLRRELLAQSLNAYEANSSLVEVAGQPVYNISEGQFCWRNTLDLAADHLVWELQRYPWVVRNIMDLYMDRYSYRDEVRFHKAPPFHPGGLAFTHDMGSYTAFSPAGQGGYEMPDVQGYCFMTTEQVLNGIYAIAAYSLVSGDSSWTRARLPVALDLMTSLENRDHPDPARRNGILEGESSKVGAGGHEITTYDCLDAELKDTDGNLYIALKTWCACLLLAECFRDQAQPEAEQRARAMADRVRQTLKRSFDPARGVFPANLHRASERYVVAVLEALAVPWFCAGRDSLYRHLTADRSFTQMLQAHATACLQPGRGLEPATGGLLLSSGSPMSWPSKAFLVVYVLEQVLDIDVAQTLPSVLRELAHWLQVSAAEKTVSDQMIVRERRAHAGSYYPRMVTSAAFLTRPR